MSENAQPRFAYFGTPVFSTYVLDALANAGFVPSLVVTTPDRPAGRGLALAESAVKQWALAHDLPILQPEKFDDAARDVIVATQCEFAIVAAYGKILPQRVLDLFPRGALNVHPSLLPRYRGTSPVESQILADEKEIGVSIILMDALMDHGPLVVQKKIEIPNWPVDRNAANGVLWHAGGALLAATIPRWLTGEIIPVPQDESHASATKKIAKEDGAIHLGEHDRVNYLKYLAYAGWPGVYFFRDGARVKIKSAEFSAGKFRALRVVPEGRSEMSYEDFARGA